MSVYCQIIQQILPGADARHVEAYMRLEVGALSELSLPAFDALAKSCADSAKLDPALAEELAETFGL